MYGSEKSFDKGNFKETTIIWQKNCNLAIESITLNIVEYRMLANDYTNFSSDVMEEDIISVSNSTREA